MAIEIERKYLDANLDEVRSRLDALGAGNSGPHFEKNVIFDMGGALYASGKILRLRMREWLQGQDCLLTFKSPFDSRRENAKSCKMREELEVKVENSQIMYDILCKLGYNPVANYEKVREEWRIAWPQNGTETEQMVVDLDFLPFCQVVEIEGAPGQMDDLAMALGLDKSKISTKSYHELHQKWLLAKGLPPTPSFVFDPVKKKRLRTLLGLSH